MLEGLNAHVAMEPHTMLSRNHSFVKFVDIRHMGTSVLKENESQHDT